MASLTSCYFCGDAVGASLAEYDLPEDASPDDQVTVTLCAGCKGKLTALFEQIDPAGASGDTAASGTSPAADPVVETDADPDVSVEPAIDDDPDLDPVAGDQEPIFADDADAVLDEGLPEDEESERPFASADDETPTSDEPDRDESGAAADSATSAGTADDADEAPSEDAQSESEDATAGSPAPEIDGDPSDARDGADTASAGSGGSDGGSGDRSGDVDRDASPVEVSAGGTATASSSAGVESSGDSGNGPLADVSPRTYNRVVRLLQNREFPVDRADFEALATSAYELDHGECAAALDGAIEKGLLEERGGELHRPE